MKLRDYLSEHGISTREFAESIGVSDVSVFRYLKGERRPEWRVMAEIFVATRGQVRPEDFFTDSDFTGLPARFPETIEA